MNIAKKIEIGGEVRFYCMDNNNVLIMELVL